MTLYLSSRDRQSSLEEYAAPMLSVLGETATQSLEQSPVGSLYRMGTLTEAERPGGQRFRGFTTPVNPMLDQDTAQLGAKDAGVEMTIPKEGIRLHAYEAILERKKEERRRAEILSRAPPGFVSGAMQFGTSIAAGMLDPINIGSAFVPVIGPARYAAMLARASGPLARLGVRAGVGAVEGTVGQALVEPLTYLSQTQSQLDYTMNDSLMNIAVGSVFGGGLHAGGGAVADALARGRSWKQAVPEGVAGQVVDSLPIKAREDALRTAVSQIVEGRHVEVEPILATSDRIGARFGPELRVSADEFHANSVMHAYHGSPHDFEKFDISKIGTGEGAQAYGHGLYFAENAGTAGTYKNAGPTADAHYAAINKQLSDLSKEMDKISTGYRKFSDPEKGKILADQYDALMAERNKVGRLYRVAIKGHPDQFLDWDKPLSEQPEKIKNALEGMGVKENPSLKPADRASVYDQLKNLYMWRDRGNDQLARDLRDAGILGVKYLDQGSRTAGEGSRNYVVFDDKHVRILEKDNQFLGDDMSATARKSFEPEAFRLADFQAAQAADEKLKAVPTPETAAQVSYDEELAKLKSLTDALGMKVEKGAVGLDTDPLRAKDGEWRKEPVIVKADGKSAAIEAGTAIDFLNTRRETLKALLECIRGT